MNDRQDWNRCGFISSAGGKTRWKPRPSMHWAMAVGSAILLAWTFGPVAPNSRLGADELRAATGVIVGEVSVDSALVQTRPLLVTDQGEMEPIAGVKVHFKLVRPAEPSPLSVEQQVVEPSLQNHSIARVRFDGLTADTEYQCELTFESPEGEKFTGPVARFRTNAGREIARQVRVAVVTGMHFHRYYSALERRGVDLEGHPGYPALETLLRVKPDYFVGTGDNVYYDHPNDNRAVTREDLRRKWQEQFSQSRYQEFFAEVPTYWEVDDHDFRRDDCDNTGDYLPSVEVAKSVLFEQLPYDLLDVEPTTFRTFRLSADLQIWLTENRLHRSPNRMEDGPEKSIWGPVQKAWLQETLAASDATFKILISPTPMIGPDDLRKKDNHCNVGGFQHERDQFFAWLEESGIADGHFYIVCGDRHWQYHSVHPSGREEFSSGAMVDANARLGRNPGDPRSTDPDGEIRQPYTQSPASGGFLMLRCEPGGENAASLFFEFYDEQGELLYEHRKGG